MNKINCIIVDDEPPAVELLSKYASMIDHLEVVGTCHSAIKAFDMLKIKKVDLMFLDIQMPVLNGIDFIKTLASPPSIILTTAYREYALDSYDLDIIDYLLKPIAFDRYLKAIDRFRDRINNPSMAYEPNEMNLDKKVDHVFFNINRTHHKVLFEDILYVESLKDYVRLHLAKGNLVVKGNLGSIMKQLPNEMFVRIHRSFAISLKNVESYNQIEVDIKGIKLPIGVSYREDFAIRIKTNL